MADISPSQLIINAGSSTIKMSLFVGQQKEISIVYEKKERKAYSRTTKKNRSTQKKAITKRTYENALKDALSLSTLKKVTLKHPIAHIGFRYVHGGQRIQKHTKITSAVIKQLKKLDHLAPLHNPHTRKLIEASQKVFPKLSKTIVVDTAFHGTIPKISSGYALPPSLTKKFGIKRYGFHGIVCASIVRQLKEKKQLKKRTIICHLGSGCSVTAVRDGQSIHTSMGFTPLEGTVMATRAGDIDPGLVLYLIQHGKIPTKKLEEILNQDSGLKALGGTKDMRVLLKSKKKEAVEAIDIFCQRAAETIAQKSVSLGSVEQIIFSGGIGENTPVIREKICHHLKHLGVRINTRKNARAEMGRTFQKAFSRVQLRWMHADEETEINRTLLERN